MKEKIRTEMLIKQDGLSNSFNAILQTTNLNEEANVEIRVTIDDIIRFQNFGLTEDDIANNVMNSLINQLIVNIIQNEQSVCTSSDFLLFKIEHFNLQDFIDAKEKILGKINEILNKSKE